LTGPRERSHAGRAHWGRALCSKSAWVRSGVAVESANLPATTPDKKANAVSLTALMGRWLKKETACIGLDAGSSSIKGVLLQKSPSGLLPPKCALQEIHPAGDAVTRLKGLQAVLQDLAAQKKPVISAVGGPGTVLRPVMVPKMTAEELKTSLRFEAEKYIPFKLDEVFIDSAILRDQAGGRMEIFIAAARKNLVQGHLEMLSAAGVVPQAVDLEPIALANAWELAPPAELGDGPAGLAHIGARGTILNFFSAKQLQFSREIPFGGEFFTRQIADGLKMNAAEAERIKRQPGDRLNEIRMLLQPKWETWTEQCRASLDFYENQYGRRVERLFLSGGSALLSGLTAGMGETFGLPVQVWNPLSAGPGLAIAVGLAARGVAG
jgi:type IV pilus assembly protein PilM